MKVLIWVGCFGLFFAVEAVAILVSGHEVNPVFTVLLSAACFLLARALSARYDERQKQKRREARKSSSKKK